MDEEVLLKSGTVYECCQIKTSSTNEVKFKYWPCHGKPLIVSDIAEEVPNLGDDHPVKAGLVVTSVNVFAGSSNNATLTIIYGQR
jgi:hypothetical protein